MKRQDLAKVLQCLEQIPDYKSRSFATELMLKAASESVELERIKKTPAYVEDKLKEEEKTVTYLKFTKKEIEGMSDNLKRLFSINDKIVTYRIVRGMYQARFRRDGYSIEVAAKTFDTMKLKFMEKLKEVDAERKHAKFPLFSEFVEEWLKIKKQTVKESTFHSYTNLAKSTVLPGLGDKYINEITRKDLQEFLFSLTDAGKNRTAQKLKQMLSAMFDVICDDYPSISNPTKKLVLSHYEVKKGRAFTKEEEYEIIEFCKANPHFYGNSALLVMMYTGMRVGELPSLKVEGDFITCVSLKTRKGYKEIVRTIPISPMMQKVLPLIDFDKARDASQFTSRDALKRIFKDRHIHEFRYTFITRAKECGCNPEAVMIWVGHEFDKDVVTSRVDRGYTTYSKEYFKSEINKIDYEFGQKC